MTASGEFRWPSTGRFPWPPSFVLGYLNSALATYFMKKLVNTTATADVGYVEKLPFRRPDVRLHDSVVERVQQIIETLSRDPHAGISSLRNEIDERIFELFAIGSSREQVRQFAEDLGRTKPATQAGSE